VLFTNKREGPPFISRRYQETKRFIFRAVRANEGNVLLANRAVIASRLRYLARVDFVLHSAELEFDRSKPHLK